MSELDYTIAPEVRKGDGFYEEIVHWSSQHFLHDFLEIGSSSGMGSTQAFIEGMSDRDHTHLYCLEVSKKRFQELTKNCKRAQGIHCVNMSSIGIEDFPSIKEIVDFYHKHETCLNRFPVEVVLKWIYQDIEYIESNRIDCYGIRNIKSTFGIREFDIVLIDGSEFTGKAEMKWLYGSKVIFLDDINAYKNYENYYHLLKDEDYKLVKEDLRLRNGYAVFVRKDCL